MAENSKIEWTDHTFNPVIGCQKVSPGCDHCYAEAMSDRYRWTTWGPHGERKVTSDENWKKPHRWNKAAEAAGVRAKVFCASLSDWLDNRWPAGVRQRLAETIYDTPWLDWLLLTKRIENYAKLAPWLHKAPPPNVWLGATAEDQERATHRGRILRDIPAAVRFFSCEPLLSSIDFEPATLLELDWIIVGGESGPGARMMQAWWAEHIRDQCRAAGVWFFMKQMTGKAPIPPHLLVREFPGDEVAA